MSSHPNLAIASYAPAEDWSDLVRASVAIELSRNRTRELRIIVSELTWKEHVDICSGLGISPEILHEWSKL